MLSHNRMVVRFTIASLFLFLLATLFILLSNRESYADQIMFSGKENHVVSLDQARTWTFAFQDGRKSGDFVAGYFGRGIFDEILNQQECAGIRIYNAKHENGQSVLVLVGVDHSGKDLSEGTLGQGMFPCPPFCPDSSPLMIFPTRQMASTR